MREDSAMVRAMFIGVAVVSGVLSYFWNLMCRYDLEAEKAGEWPLQQEEEDGRQPMPGMDEAGKKPVQKVGETGKQPVQRTEEAGKQPIQGMEAARKKPMQGEERDRRQPLQGAEAEMMGRWRFLIRMDGRRGIALMFCLAVCMGLTWLFMQYGYGPLKAVRYLMLLAILYPIAREDAREKRIPNRWLLYILLCRGILFAAEMVLFPALRVENLKFTLFGGMVSGAVFYVAYVLSRHAVGMGDVKLVAVIGMCLGAGTAYLVMVVSLIFSAFYGGFQVLRKKKGMKDEIAFGPFLALGTLTVLLIGA